MDTETPVYKGASKYLHNKVKGFSNQKRLGKSALICDVQDFQGVFKMWLPKLCP